MFDFVCRRCEGELHLLIGTISKIDIYRCSDCGNKFEVIKIDGVKRIIKDVSDD